MMCDCVDRSPHRIIARSPHRLNPFFSLDRLSIVQPRPLIIIAQSATRIIMSQSSSSSSATSSSTSASSSSSSPSAALTSLVLDLFALDAICLAGPYVLKSGLVSPFYIDLRRIVSKPTLMQRVAAMMYALVADGARGEDAPPESKDASASASGVSPFHLLCGVPYTALPLATLMSASSGVPMLMRRKEAKSYGLKRSVEGVYSAGQTCLVVEDLVTTGMSVFETIEPLEECGLVVRDVLVFLDREQGGNENISARGLRLHAVVTITQVMHILASNGKITAEVVAQVDKFVKDNRVAVTAPSSSTPPLSTAAATPVASPTPARFVRTLSYADRVSHCANGSGRALLRLMEMKRTNLCLSADVTTSAELLSLAAKAGPYICMLKTHIDILADYTPSVITELQRLSREHKFLLFEDRKYADIGSTVQSQYAGGMYRTAEWSQVINAHGVAGSGIIAGLRAAADGYAKSQKSATQGSEEDAMHSTRGLLMIAEMSSEGSLATGAYTAANVKMAEDNDDFVFGFICQRAVSSRPGMLHLSPGVQLPPASSASSSSSSTSTGGDNLGQQYRSPSTVIGVDGSDVIIVGRAIIKAKNVEDECKRYQTEGWKAYEESRAEAIHKA